MMLWSEYQFFKAKYIFSSFEKSEKMGVWVPRTKSSRPVGLNADMKGRQQEVRAPRLLVQIYKGRTHTKTDNFLEKF